MLQDQTIILIGYTSVFLVFALCLSLSPSVSLKQPSFFYHVYIDDDENTIGLHIWPHTHTHKFSSSPPSVWTGWATVGRRNVYIYRKADWLKWLNDWLCGKTLYLTHHDVNTRLDRCHGFSLTWLRRALLISNIQGQMLRHSDGLSLTHTYTQPTRDMASNIRSYRKSHNDDLVRTMHFCRGPGKNHRANKYCSKCLENYFYLITGL